MKLFITLFLCLIQFSAYGKLLDKILAVYDDQIITKSMIKRIRSNLDARRNILANVYNKAKFNDKELVTKLIQKNLIRAKIIELGYNITDEEVEENIKSTERNLGLTRTDLLSFLNSNNMTFDEYFELTRSAIEYSLFSARIINPLITITEQEIKNAFYQENIKNKTLAFKYTLIDFSINKNHVSKKMLNNFKKVLSRFQGGEPLPGQYAGLETNVLGDITEDGLTQGLKNLLKKTDEGSFSEPFLLNNQYHVFFVKKKDLVESGIFTEAKNRIKAKLFKKRSEQTTSLWFQREQNKHYIKYFF